jgi:transposase-like protein
MKRSMVKRKRRKFTPEFKADTVRLIRESDKPLAHIARDLDLPHSVLRAWIAQADIDEQAGSEGPLTTTEREELARLRRENKQLQMEREILKKAAAFFAKEST